MVPRRRAHRAPHPRLHPLERGGDGRQGQQARRRHRRPPVHVRQLGQRSTRSASTTSSGARTTASPATTSTSRATPRPASTPGPSSRAASTEDDLDHFRREIGARRGLSIYPHPRLMPDFWEFPTVSMGLGPITALYHARFNRYLHNRQHRRHQPEPGVVLPRRRRVRRARDARRHLAGQPRAARQPRSSSSTATCSASTARCAATARSSRSSRPMFRGAGWNVIKVIWGSKWDELLAKDKDGVLLNKMNTTVDGEFQRYARRERRVHPRALLRPRPAAAQDGRAPVRRRAAQPAPRRPRLPQAVRGLQGGHREPRHGRADGRSWPRRSRAGRSARASRAATPPTRSRR